jgi:hypothetical protein
MNRTTIAMVIVHMSSIQFEENFSYRIPRISLGISLEQKDVPRFQGKKYR